MSKLVRKFMWGIIATGGLVAGAGARADDRPVDAVRFEKSCRKLADLAVYGWADVERSVDISCLGTGAIPSAAYESMVREFLEDCTDVVVKKIGPGLGRSERREVRLSRDEVTRMFVHRYDPVFKRYCARLNPGKGIVARPGPSREA